MKKLVWFVLGFAAAIALCAYVLFGFWMLLMGGVCLVAALALLALGKRVPRAVALLLIGAAVGSVYSWGFDAAVLEHVRFFDGQTLTVEITAKDYSFDTGYGKAVDGTVRLDGRKYQLRLFYSGEGEIEPGDRIHLRAQLRYTPKGGLQTSTFHKGEGKFLLAYARQDMTVQRCDQAQLRYFAAYSRKYIARQIDRAFPQDTAAFARALLIGDDTRLSFRENIFFQNSGIRHIVAVSGLHVSILFSVVYFVTGRKRLPVLLAGLPLLFAFAAVAGFSPSVVRACIMQALLIISLAVDRQYDVGTALAFSCLVMLTANPLTVTSASFQLSVGSMLGIFLFSQPIRDWMYKKELPGRKTRLRGILRGWLVGSVSVSVSAMIFTLPLCAIYFGCVTPAGIVTNLAVLWMVPAVFCGVAVVCIAAALWLPAGTAAGWVVSWGIRYIQGVSALFSKIPALYTQSIYAVVWVVLSLALLAVFLCSKKRSVALLTATVAVMYALSLSACWIEPRLANFQMTAVDVGQGQCVLLRSGSKAYMVDCGGSDPEQAAQQALQTMGAQGITRLDGLILTHFDEDHCNGVEHLLSVFPVERLYLPESRDEFALSHSWVPTSRIREATQLDCDGAALQLVPAKNITDGNESSMCILFQAKNCDILITGDRDISGEEEFLSQYTLSGPVVLVAGHHGASTSTGYGLLQQLRPQIAVISVGANNINGHPHSQVLQRLAEFGCQIRRTDMEGTITIRG